MSTLPVMGRHLWHDPRSLNYAIAPKNVRANRATPILWTRRSPILDQGEIGSCTGNALAGAVATDSHGRTGRPDVTEKLALEFYKLATQIDPFPGVYPPEDTGSSGLAVAKAGKRLGYLTSYEHAYTLSSVLTALQSGPCIVGTNWLSGMDRPGKDGIVRYSGSVRGGHEYELVGWEPTAQRFVFANSWGTSWGADGYFRMSYTDFGKALRTGGDVVSPQLV